MGNLQLLLQVGTINGGASSRSQLMQSTMAVADEMTRDETLNVYGSCIRHSMRQVLADCAPLLPPG